MANFITRLFNKEKQVESRSFVHRDFLTGTANGPVAVDTAGALKIDIVYAVIKVISESFASLPTKIYSKKGDNIQLEKDHDQYNLLKKNFFTKYSKSLKG